MQNPMKPCGGWLAAIGLAGLLLALPAGAAEEEKFLALMNSYLTLGNTVVDTAERPEAAVFLAIEGIFEVYEQRRDAPGAVKHFQRLLEQR